MIEIRVMGKRSWKTEKGRRKISRVGRMDKVGAADHDLSLSLSSQGDSVLFTFLVWLCTPRHELLEEEDGG